MNAITWSSLDDNIVLSLRNQDWVIKINYKNGAGDGRVLWRLGKAGDFTLVPASPLDWYPWFSHQHDANYLDGTTLTLFDNGNTRCFVRPQQCDSRGQEYLLDETTHVVKQTLNVDLGNYSPALGTAQRLDNGNFNFDSGHQTSSLGTFGQAIEVQRSGTQLYVETVDGPLYRAWRLPTLYSPTNPPCPSCAPGH
jgi:hypothetical protein